MKSCFGANKGRKGEGCWGFERQRVGAKVREPKVFIGELPPNFDQITVESRNGRPLIHGTAYGR